MLDQKGVANYMFITWAPMGAPATVRYVSRGFLASFWVHDRAVPS